MEKNEINYVEMVLDVYSGYFGIADQKHGLWLAFPIRKFDKNDNGRTEITIVVLERDIETITDMNDWINEMRSKFKENQEKKEGSQIKSEAEIRKKIEKLDENGLFSNIQVINALKWVLGEGDD